VLTFINADVDHTEMFGRLAERAATYGYLGIEAAVTSGSWVVGVRVWEGTSR